MDAVVREGILEILNEKFQITYNELCDMMIGKNVDRESLDKSLLSLEQDKIIAMNSNGGIKTYYPLQDQQTLRKVIIVEDDKNINKLMSLSVGKNFEITQIYDGGEAMAKIRAIKPDLVILDLMLPHKDGLDICQTIKCDPETKNTAVIIISAMDPTSNRFKGIKYGADYYIKKPFDPLELRNLTTLFLNKKGKRFDPLIDLPNEERISEEIERYMKEGEKYTMGTLKIEKFSTYVSQFTPEAGLTILRLISQLLQDRIKNDRCNAFVGFLNSDEFVIAGNKSEVDSIANSITKEFEAVLPFILQDQGYKLAGLEFVENLFESNEIPHLYIVYTESEKEKLKERRSEILKLRNLEKNEVGLYTYNELQKLFGRDDLDVRITRDPNGVKLHVGKEIKKKEE